MTKRLIRIALFSFVGLVVIGVGLFLLLARSGSGTVEGWIGSQIQTIANSYLNPQLSFSDLDYQYPFTVSLKNMHLTADDPEHPGKKIDIVACSMAAVTLGEIPAIGKPIVIEKIVLEKPLISAIAVAPKSKDFVGFSNLIRGAKAAPAAEEKKPADKTASTPQKLSDVFRMKLVQLVDGKIVYNPRIPGTVPMELDQINTALNIESGDGGWYKLNTVITRKPVFEVQVGGQLNLDTFNVRGFALNLMADLGSSNLSYLPPELQELLKQYDARGKLQLDVTGDMPVMDPTKGTVAAKVKLDGANLAVGDLKMPVDSLSLAADFKDNKVSLTSLKIAALDGTADLSGSTSLNDRLDADLHLQVSGMVLEKLLAKSAPSPARGKLDLEFNVTGSLMSIIGKAPAPASGPLAAINLKNFRLAADDPANPGQKIDVLACQNLEVALTEPILPGKPIVVEKIILDQPGLAAVAIAPNSMQFAGIPAVAAPATPPAAPAAAPVSTVAAPAAKQHISDLIRVKTFQLNNAKLIYDPRIPGTQRMRIDQVTTAVNLDPANPDIYKVTFDLQRKPVLDLTIDANVNLDALSIDGLKLNLIADLKQNQRDFLPPQLQALLKQSDVTGKISLLVTGGFPVADPMKGKLQLESKLENVDLASGNLHVPVKTLDLAAKLDGGKAEVSTLKIATLNSVFDLSALVDLGARMESDVKVKLSGVVLENLVAALNPDQPAPKTSTKVDAEIEVKSPVMVALGAAPRNGNEPAATLTITNVKLTTDDPTAPGKPLDFVAMDKLGVVLGSLPQPGKPIVVDRITLDHPMLRAVALAPNSPDFAGFANLQKLAGTPMPAKPQSPTPATASPAPATQPSQKLSDLFRVQLVELNNAGVYYNPRIPNTGPMSMEHISTKINLASPTGELYAFNTTIPNAPLFNLTVDGKVNIDKLTAEGLKLALASDLSYQKKLDYYPPQIQQMLTQYQTEGALAVDVNGSLPLTDPMGGNLQANVRLDNLKATSGDWRVPIDHVRIPMHVANRKAEIQPADALGGPMVEAFSGRLNLTGIVMLNEKFDSDLKLLVDDLQIKQVMAAKKYVPPPVKPGEKPVPPPDPNSTVGKVHAEIVLTKAPLLAIAAQASPPPASSSAAPSPLAMMPLPEDWGTGTIAITEARLAGFEIIQKMGNVARNLFADVLKKDSARSDTVNPKETALVTFNLTQDRIEFSKIHYEGEIVAVDDIKGGGTMTLAQIMDLRLTGGPLQKVLNRSGAAGDFVKTFTDALLIYHIYGPASKPEFDFERGDGKPVEAKLKVLAAQSSDVFDKGVNVVGKGLNEAGKGVGRAFDWLTGGKKKDE